MGLLGLACIFARLAGAVEEEAVEGHELGLEGIEFDLCQLAFGDFAPAVDVGFALDLFAAVEVAQEFAGVIAGSDFAKCGAREGFDGVAAQKLGPVVLEKIAGGEDVAPGNFATVGDDYADDVFALSPEVARAKRRCTSSTKLSTETPTGLSL